jgi:hypothetical protein
MVRARILLYCQGIYFLITGIWPLAHMPSFLKVTGDKVDLWLVDTVGLLVGAIGIGLLLAARRAFPEASTIAIAMGSAAGLAFIDIKYVITGTIAPVYLGDAVAQLGLLLWWANVLWRSRDHPQ